MELKKEAKNLQALLKNRSAIQNMHPNEVATILKTIHINLEDKFLDHFLNLPDSMLGDVILELPEDQRNLVISKLSSEKLKIAMDTLETDDALELMENIEEIDLKKAEIVFNKLSKQDRDELKKLKSYEENSAGAYMQTEVFDAFEGELIIEAIEKFKKLKSEGELENVSQVFITNKNEKFIASIRLDDLILLPFDRRFNDILHDTIKYSSVINRLSINDKASISDGVKIFQDYDISSIAVVDDDGVLVGRITSDDVYDIIQDSATKQIYSLAGVGHGSDIEEIGTGKWSERAIWLFVNLGTMLIASFIIGAFEETLHKYVALAILMPIIPAISGNAGIQALTVTVRKIALGEINPQTQKSHFLKELRFATFHALALSSTIVVITMIWFGDLKLAITMGLAVITALVAAGALGAIVPIVLKRLNIDPAVGSSVVITGVLDSLAFFTLFGLATLIMM